VQQSVTPVRHVQSKSVFRVSQSLQVAVTVNIGRRQWRAVLF